MADLRPVSSIAFWEVWRLMSFTITHCRYWASLINQLTVDMPRCDLSIRFTSPLLTCNRERSTGVPRQWLFWRNEWRLFQPGGSYIEHTRRYSFAASHATNDRAFLGTQFSLAIPSAPWRFPLFVGEARYGKLKAGGYGLLISMPDSSATERARHARKISHRSGAWPAKYVPNAPFLSVHSPKRHHDCLLVMCTIVTGVHMQISRIIENDRARALEFLHIELYIE